MCIAWLMCTTTVSHTVGSVSTLGVPLVSTARGVGVSCLCEPVCGFPKTVLSALNATKSTLTSYTAHPEGLVEV